MHGLALEFDLVAKMKRSDEEKKRRTHLSAHRVDASVSWLIDCFGPA